MIIVNTEITHLSWATGRETETAHPSIPGNWYHTVRSITTMVKPSSHILLDEVLLNYKAVLNNVSGTISLQFCSLGQIPGM